MGFLDGFFGGSKEPTGKKIASAVAALQLRHGEPARRYEAADRLAEWKTPEAIAGLLQRFTVAAASETSDARRRLASDTIVPATSTAAAADLS